MPHVFMSMARHSHLSCYRLNYVRRDSKPILIYYYWSCFFSILGGNYCYGNVDCIILVLNFLFFKGV